MNIEKLIDYLIENASAAFEHQDRELLKNVLKRYFDNEQKLKSKTPGYFEYALCTRKNGTKFIKITAYSADYGDDVEIARINLSKNEWVQDNFSIKDIFGELKSK